MMGSHPCASKDRKVRDPPPTVGLEHRQLADLLARAPMPTRQNWSRMLGRRSQKNGKSPPSSSRFRIVSPYWVMPGRN